MELIKANGKMVSEEQEISRCLTRWNPLDPYVLVNSATHQTSSVLCVEGYASLVMKSLKRRVSLILFYEFAAITALFLVWTYTGNVRAINSLIGLGAVWIFQLLDTRLVTLNVLAVRERSMFAFFIRQNFFGGARVWIAFMLVCGGIQIVCSYLLQGFTPTMMRFGVVYDCVLGGQWWRVLFGPVLHASFVHWLVNLAFLLAVGPIADFVSRRHAGIVFILGVVGGAIASVLFDKLHDSFVGISGGIYSLLGWCAACSFLRPRVLPKRFGVTVVSFSLMSIVVSAAFNINASSISHVAGLFLGLFYGLFTARFVGGSDRMSALMRTCIVATGMRTRPGQA